MTITETDSDNENDSDSYTDVDSESERGSDSDRDKDRDSVFVDDQDTWILGNTVVDNGYGNAMRHSCHKYNFSRPAEIAFLLAFRLRKFDCAAFHRLTHRLYLIAIFH